MLEQLSDEQLTNQARLGDHDAFNVLLARHRDKAFGWAKKVTNDTHMAEDVVQESLIRAFMKMATLVDLNKFLPWLKTIVRNQAMMKLRRGGAYRRFKSLPADRWCSSHVLRTQFGSDGRTIGSDAYGLAPFGDY